MKRLLGKIIFLVVLVKIYTLKELIAETHAYELIAEEEKLEIQNKKEREKREKELHKSQMEFIRKQSKEIDYNQRKNLLENSFKGK